MKTSKKKWEVFLFTRAASHILYGKKKIGVKGDPDQGGE